MLRCFWSVFAVAGLVGGAAILSHAFAPQIFSRRSAARCWDSLHKETTEQFSSRTDYVHLEHIDRVFCISDLHVDHGDNMQWLANHTRNEHIGINLGKSDLIVLAGDLSHDIDRIEQALMYLIQTGASILFVAGNHEAWIHSKEVETLSSSLEKIEQVYQTCRDLGVYVQECIRVGGTEDRPYSLWTVPLDSWYDGSLSIQECHDLCEDFGKWPWVDFIKCQWPEFQSMSAPNERIPDGLAQYYIDRNRELIQKTETWIAQDDKSRLGGGLMTVSHFLPSQRCLPDWKVLEAPSFRREEWLEHGGGGLSAKFAKVAGTNLLDRQIRSMELPIDGSISQRFHVFGHSHRPKDFYWEGIRYIHNPLGKPRERDIFMVSPSVDFQEVWNTQTGEVTGEQVIRYWDEYGGGVEALVRRMANSKRKTRYGKFTKGKSQTGKK